MTGPFRAWACCAAFLLLGAGQVSAQALLEPPFGLHWGEAPEKLLGWASRHALDVTIALPSAQAGLRIIKIQPRKGLLPGSQAAALEGRFLGGRLYELTVHYFDPEATADTMAARFEVLRKQLGVQHGAFAADQQQRTVEDKFATKTLAFHREPVKGLFVLLALTEVEDLLRQSREARFSLIYRNENFKNEMQKAFDDEPTP
ncbi:MAG: hypothetical protein DVB25_08770 [Verrucomicrobia bacterium]|nr:MAG: hypothetical protein DVB25_08770 [Verrucomicrobiota bacterium]